MAGILTFFQIQTWFAGGLKSDSDQVSTYLSCYSCSKQILEWHLCQSQSKKMHPIQWARIKTLHWEESVLLNSAVSWNGKRIFSLSYFHCQQRWFLEPVCCSDHGFVAAESLFKTLFQLYQIPQHCMTFFLLHLPYLPSLSPCILPFTLNSFLFPLASWRVFFQIFFVTLVLSLSSFAPFNPVSCFFFSSLIPPQLIPLFLTISIHCDMLM